MPKKPQAVTLQDVLNDHATGMASILRRFLAIEQLEKVARAAVTQALERHLHVANVREDLLILVTDRPAMAARLRLERASILKALAAAGLAVKDVQFIINPSLVVPEQPADHPPVQLSPAARAQLLEVAKDTRDKALRRSLKALANVGRPGAASKPPKKSAPSNKSASSRKPSPGKKATPAKPPPAKKTPAKKTAPAKKTPPAKKTAPARKAAGKPRYTGDSQPSGEGTTGRRAGR